MLTFVFFVFVVAAMVGIAYDAKVGGFKFQGVHEEIELTFEERFDRKVFENEWRNRHPGIVRDAAEFWLMNKKFDMMAPQSFIEDFLYKQAVSDMVLVPNISMFESDLKLGIKKIVQQHDWN